MLVLAPFFAAQAFAAIAAQLAPDACTNLSSALGLIKVASSPLEIDYTASREDYWNARQSDYFPACVVYPSSAADVSQTLQTVREYPSTRFAIKAGGHNPNNFFSSVSGGVLIDLGTMTNKSYDADSGLATYQPGNRWADLYAYYDPYGVTVMGGRLGGVGSGLALGGGLSYLGPQYGMACDSFLELEVVLPNGTIVTASNTTNPDLFLGLRGGGGNAFGVVTKYTVQTRPAGTFYAGNIIYLFERTDVFLNALRDFVEYNTDPKASALATYLILTTPDLNLDLDEIIVLFLVYDGPDPGEAFANFTAIPYFLNTLGQKTYPEVAEMPLPLAAALSRADNIFRDGVHRVLDNDTSYLSVFDAWRAWASANKNGSYVYTGLNLYPVSRSLTDASHAAGGNAMGMMPDGPWLWVSYQLSSDPLLDVAAYAAVQASFADMVKEVPNAEGLPLFLNEAARDQKPLQTFARFEDLKALKEKVDPEGFFANGTGEWSFE